MTNLSSSPFLFAAFLINLIICILSFYSALVNLLKKRTTIIGFDALILSLIQIFDKRQVIKIKKDPKLIRKLGIMMIFVGIGTLSEVMRLITNGF